MLDAGLDESKSSSKLLTVSAVVGQTSRMAKFTNAWNASLRKNGVDFFHAKDHWNKRSKPYHGLSTSKRKVLLQDLIRHIHKFATFGVTICIDIPEYDAITTPRFRSQWGSSYAFAMQLLMIVSHFDLGNRSRLHELVNILIEDGHANSKQAFEILHKAIGRNDYWLKVKTCELGGKLGNPILQAADMLAYSSCQHHAKGTSLMYQKLVHKAPIPFITLPWNKSCIQAITKDIGDFVERRRQEREKAWGMAEAGEVVILGE